MRLSWNEIKIRAARFADEWKNARYERGESQTFYNEFFEIFGVTRRRVASFEEPVKRLGKERVRERGDGCGDRRKGPGVGPGKLSAVAVTQATI